MFEDVFEDIFNCYIDAGASEKEANEIIKKMETHNFIKMKNQNLLKCQACGRVLIYGFIIKYGVNKNNQILTCDELIIKDIVQ